MRTDRSSGRGETSAAGSRFSTALDRLLGEESREPIDVLDRRDAGLRLALPARRGAGHAAREHRHEWNAGERRQRPHVDLG
jgi:hypothetical protein